MNISSLTKQLEEFNLIKCSLLPDEIFGFLDEEETWTNLTVAQATSAIDIATHEHPSSLASIRITIHPLILLEIHVPISYSGSLVEAPFPTFAIKGDQISRADQDRWQEWIQEQLREIGETEWVVSAHKNPLPLGQIP